MVVSKGTQHLKDGTLIITTLTDFGDKLQIKAVSPCDSVSEFLWLKKTAEQKYSWYKLFQNLEIKINSNRRMKCKEVKR